MNIPFELKCIIAESLTSITDILNFTSLCKEHRKILKYIELPAVRVYKESNIMNLIPRINAITFVNIKNLKIYKYNPFVQSVVIKFSEITDLTRLIYFTNLKILKLIWCKLHDLNPITNLKYIKTLEIYNCKNIYNIPYIDNLSLKIFNCKNVIPP